MLPQKEVIHFWFTESSPQKWFVKDDKFDQTIRDRFEQTYHQAALGALDSWADTPEGSLALVIVLDQFSRNMFRGSPKSFATDAHTLNIAKTAIKKGFDKKLENIQRQFLYMPFMHSEILHDQEEGIALFKLLNNQVAVDYAIQHRDIIARFGRFPHRNAVLGRSSTNEELQFLLLPGSSF